MSTLHLIALSPMTGDDSPTIRVVVLLLLGAATAATLFLGVWKGKRK